MRNRTKYNTAKNNDKRQGEGKSDDARGETGKGGGGKEILITHFCCFTQTKAKKPRNGNKPNRKKNRNKAQSLGVGGEQKRKKKSLGGAGRAEQCFDKRGLKFGNDDDARTTTTTTTRVDEDDDREKKGGMWDGTYKKNVIVRGTIAVIDTNFARKHVGNVSSKKKKGGTQKRRGRTFLWGGEEVE